MNIFSNYHLPFDFFMTVFRCKSIFMHETCQIFLCNAIFFFFIYRKSSHPEIRQVFSWVYFLIEHFDASGILDYNKILVYSRLPK